MDKTTSGAILRLPKVMQRTGLARSTIYKLVAAREFPLQVRLTRHAVGWYEIEIDAWVVERSRAKST